MYLQRLEPPSTLGEVNAFARHFMCVLFSCVLSLTGALCRVKIGNTSRTGPNPDFLKFEKVRLEMVFVARLMRYAQERAIVRPDHPSYRSFYKYPLSPWYPDWKDMIWFIPFWELKKTQEIDIWIIRNVKQEIQEKLYEHQSKDYANLKEFYKNDLNYRWQHAVMECINHLIEIGKRGAEQAKIEEEWMQYLRQAFAWGKTVGIVSTEAATTPAAGSQTPAAANPPAGVVVPASGAEKEDEEIEEEILGDSESAEGIDTTPNTPAQSVPGTPGDQLEDTPPTTPKGGQKKAGGYDKNKQRTVKEGDDAEEARKNRMCKPVDDKNKERDEKVKAIRDVRPSSAPANRTGQNEHLSFDDIAERLDRLQDW